MGYRSDVAYAVHGNAEAFAKFKEVFETELNSLNSEVRANVDELINSSEYETNRKLFVDTSFVFYATSVKWYDTYLAVQFFDRIFDQGEALELTGELAIIGEDMNDTEYWSYGPEPSVLNITREIVINI